MSINDDLCGMCGAYWTCDCECAVDCPHSPFVIRNHFDEADKLLRARFEDDLVKRLDDQVAAIRASGVLP